MSDPWIEYNTTVSDAAEKLMATFNVKKVGIYWVASTTFGDRRIDDTSGADDRGARIALYQKVRQSVRT